MFFDISEKFQYQVWNIKRVILGQKIKVKKMIKIYFPRKLKMFNMSYIWSDRENCNLLFGVKHVEIPAIVPKIEPFYYIGLKPQVVYP